MTPGEMLDRLSTDTRWQSLVWAALVLVVVTWGMVRWGGARSEVDRANGRYHTVARDVQRIADLRLRTVAVAGHAQLDADLVSRVQRALNSIGLPASACRGVQPRAEQADGNAGPKWQSVELQLKDLTPGEFGSWLSAWATPDQPWHIREIILNHTLTGQDTTSMDSNRFQISLLLSAPAVEGIP